MSQENMDVTRKFVRVTADRADGFVEFDFAIGEPELFVELLMSRAAFEDFCRTNQVILLEGPRPEFSGENDENDQGGWDWRLKQATSQHFRE